MQLNLFSVIVLNLEIHRIGFLWPKLILLLACPFEKNEFLNYVFILKTTISVQFKKVHFYHFLVITVLRFPCDQSGLFFIIISNGLVVKKIISVTRCVAALKISFASYTIQNDTRLWCLCMINSCQFCISLTRIIITPKSDCRLIGPTIYCFVKNAVFSWWSKWHSCKLMKISSNCR